MELAGRFRLNASHLDDDSLERWLNRLEQIFEARGETRPVVVDLQGAKMRVGEMAPADRLPDELTLVCAPGPETAAGAIPVPHPELFEAVRPGERLTLNDARVELEVTAHGGHRLGARVVRNGPLSAHKGINRPDHPIPYRRLRDRDRAVVRRATRRPFCQLAFSFVLDGSEVPLLRAETNAHLVAKLERPEALPHVSAIAHAFDEIWFCRGDLGAQAGLSALGPLQRRFAAAVGDLPVPALLAGQVLEHMSSCPEPTRTEVVHLYDAACSGWAGIVLSDETANGRDPVAVARFLCGLPYVRRGDRTPSVSPCESSL
jgi:pyruvate kinase